MIDGTRIATPAITMLDIIGYTVVTYGILLVVFSIPALATSLKNVRG